MCPICGRKFAQRPGYTYHMRTHSGDKRYQCKVCEKSFIQIGTIKRHCETHDLTNCSVDDLIIKLDEMEKVCSDAKVALQMLNFMLNFRSYPFKAFFVKS